MGALTELDLCVLGVIWRSGPLTAYRVRKEFRESTTAAWSSSAGSIYPSIRRLLEAGLATTAPVAEDKRGTQSLKITGEGLERLRAWLTNLAPELGTANPDPLRTRAHFLTSIPAEQRVRFVDRARAITRASLAELEAEAERNRSDPDGALEQVGTLGAIFELRARLEWLDQVLATLPPQD